MTNLDKSLTPSTIKYLLAVAKLCRSQRGARCVDVAACLGVSKPSAHAMIRNLCQAGLTGKEPSGNVYLTEEGERLSNLYQDCYEPLCQRMQDILGLEGEACRNAACAILAEMPEELPQLARRLQ